MGALPGRAARQRGRQSAAMPPRSSAPEGDTHPSMASRYPRWPWRSGACATSRRAWTTSAGRPRSSRFPSPGRLGVAGECRPVRTGGRGALQRRRGRLLGARFPLETQAAPMCATVVGNIGPGVGTNPSDERLASAARRVEILLGRDPEPPYVDGIPPLPPRCGMTSRPDRGGPHAPFPCAGRPVRFPSSLEGSDRGGTDAP